MIVACIGLCILVKFIGASIVYGTVNEVVGFELITGNFIFHLNSMVFTTRMAVGRLHHTSTGSISAESSGRACRFSQPRRSSTADPFSFMSKSQGPARCNH